MTFPTLNQLLQIIGIPLVFTIAGIFAKGLSKHNEDDISKLRNDFAVNSTLIFSTLAKIISDTLEAKSVVTQNGQSLLDARITAWLVGVILAGIISLYYDRYASWIKVDGKSISKKHMFWGIILPDIISIVIFCSYQTSKVLS